jgi:hypothetical protein
LRGRPGARGYPFCFEPNAEARPVRRPCSLLYETSLCKLTFMDQENSTGRSRRVLMSILQASATPSRHLSVRGAASQAWIAS